MSSHRPPLPPPPSDSHSTGVRTRVLQHHYNALSQKWTKTQSEIVMDDKPFAEGAFRAAFHAQMSWEGQDNVRFVCKFAKDPATPKSMYFNDVEAHEVAALYAKSFSAALNPPPSFGSSNGSGSGASSSRKQYPPVSYVAAFIVEFVDKPGRPVCGCEQALAGTFRKYNNNVGAVCNIAPEDATELRARAAAASAAQAAAAAAGLPAPSVAPPLENWDPQSTAQAFSHYSFEQSKSQLLICDIQGVENRFTDPQIHTLSGKGFGLGNLGQTGIRAFLLRHVCTDLCRAVGLPPVRAKDLHEKAVIPNFNNLPIHLNVTAVAGAGAGAGSGTAGQQQQQRRHASTDQSQSQRMQSQQLMLAAAASSGSRSAAATNSRNPTPAASRSPSASPRGLGGEDYQQQHQSAAAPAASLRSSPPLPSSSIAAASSSSEAHSSRSSSRAPAPQPQPKKPATLDDSDEALMASIMGD